MAEIQIDPNTGLISWGPRVLPARPYTKNDIYQRIMEEEPQRMKCRPVPIAHCDNDAVWKFTLRDATDNYPYSSFAFCQTHMAQWCASFTEFEAAAQRLKTMGP